MAGRDSGIAQRGPTAALLSLCSGRRRMTSLALSSGVGYPQGALVLEDIELEGTASDRSAARKEASDACSGTPPVGTPRRRRALARRAPQHSPKDPGWVQWTSKRLQSPDGEEAAAASAVGVPTDRPISDEGSVYGTATPRRSIPGESSAQPPPRFGEPGGHSSNGAAPSREGGKARCGLPTPSDEQFSKDGG